MSRLPVILYICNNTRFGMEECGFPFILYICHYACLMTWHFVFHSLQVRFVVGNSLYMSLCFSVFVEVLRKEVSTKRRGLNARSLVVYLHRRRVSITPALSSPSWSWCYCYQCYRLPDIFYLATCFDLSCCLPAWYIIDWYPFRSSCPSRYL